VKYFFFKKGKRNNARNVMLSLLRMG